MVVSLIMGPLIYAMTVDFRKKDEKETMDRVTHKSLCWSCYTMTFQDCFQWLQKMLGYLDHLSSAH